MIIARAKFAELIGSRIPCNINKKRFFDYTKKTDLKEFAIFQRSVKGKEILAAFQNTIIIKKSDVIFWIVPHYKFPYIKYRITLDEKTFPGLLKRSKILKCMLLPYMRIVDKDKYLKSIRLCVITDKGQIYHNYPARSQRFDGKSKTTDINCFEESVIWDVPGRKYPSSNPNCLDTECYYPNLPEECYQYHPMPNDDDKFVDIYGNGGFPKYTYVFCKDEKVKVSRFYQYNRTEQSNPFYFIGSGEKNWKLNIIATYRANVEEGVRTCIFATHDGGRSWYCKYEFSDIGEYCFKQGHEGRWGQNFGNVIKSNERNVYDTDLKVSLRKRGLLLPKKREKTVKFIWSEKVIIKKIICEESILLETNTEHGLTTGNIIAINSETNAFEELEQFKWMFNNHINENSCGNEILFKVEVISKTRIRLYELVSTAQNSLPCRHVHHINKIKDGWIIGTGEVYPNSWILFFQVKEADTYTPCYAWNEFPIVRLNSLETSIERTMGVIMKDDEFNTIIYASDHDMSRRKKISLNGEEISRNSTGVFSGKLEDIDDRDKYNCIFEASEPCFYFQEVDDMYIFCGQRGTLALTHDCLCGNWIKDMVDKPIIHYLGNVDQFYVFNDVVIQKK